MLIGACTGGGLEPINEGRCREANNGGSATAGSALDDPDFRAFVDAHADSSPEVGWAIGDLHLADTAMLYSYYRAHSFESRPTGDVHNRSTVACTNTDFDWIWEASDKLAITYCFGPFPDVALGTYVREQTRIAMAEFERAADINFVQIAANEEECTALWQDRQVRIIVRQTIECDGTSADIGKSCDCKPSGPRCVGRGFALFPRHPDDESRRVKIVFRPKLLDTPYKSNNQAGPSGTVLHEVGHAAGLDHEHVRWKQVSYTQGNEDLSKPQAKSPSWRALTPADPASIMGYPDCDEINDRAVARLSAGDRLGLHYLYSLPRTEPIHFDNDTSDDILWIGPKGQAMEVWYGGALEASGESETGGDIEAIGSIQLTKVPFLLPGGDEISGRNKAAPLRLTDTSLTSVLLHSPGADSAAPDVLLHPTGSQGTPFERVYLQQGGEAAEQTERQQLPT